jgi:PAS domain S-box-containing protein
MIRAPVWEFESQAFGQTQRRRRYCLPWELLSRPAVDPVNLPAGTKANEIRTVETALSTDSERCRMPPDTYYSADMARAIIETTTQPLLVLDQKLIVRQCNSAFLSTFQVSREETDGKPIQRLGNGQWEITNLLHLLDTVQEKKTPVKNYRVEHHFEQIGSRIMLLNATPILADGMVDNILLAISDITERELLRFQLDGQKEYSEKIVDASRDAGICV